MLIRVRAFSLPLAFFLMMCGLPLPAQRAANANAYYQQLRALLPGGEVIAVNNLELKRDAAIFTFRHGNIAFYGEVNGKVTGAIFKGDGHLHITPPTVEERHNLEIVAHVKEFDEDFDQVVMRFTDSTAAELHKGSAGKGDADSVYARNAQEFQSFARVHLHQNYDLRILQDVLSPAPGGFFLAAIHGKKNGHLIFTFDPNGVPGVSPEEVGLLNWSDWGETFPLAFHRAAEYTNGSASGNEHNAAYRILNEKLDVSIEKSGFLSSFATVEVRAEQEGVAVIPLDIYPTLRVSRAETGKGDALDWVQERKEDDPQFGVVLAQPLKKGETATLKITYGGKDVVINEGNGNYYPVARENWYPNASQGLGDYAMYEMVFHVPKNLQIIATGTKVNQSTDGGITTSEWKTEVPLAVVGFSVGDFTTKEEKLGNPLAGELTIDAYANKEPPDMVARMAESGPFGTLSTTPMLATELNEGEVAAQLYTNYFGALSFAHISLTQQSACNYGQSWPMLVYLPICGFFDDTQRHFMGLGAEDMYWKVVTPHEVAHQWWGQTVGFRGYRDQWMSEGFAQTSASIYLQATRPKPNEFLEFWKQQRRLITEKNAFGFRPIDVGPVTMGFRLMSPKAGWDIYQNLVYPKGAYILHMVRMMMWTPQEGDSRFKATMHDFLDSHRMQAATTEDFKAAVEKHMSQAMDLDGNHKMNWFFNEYVYGIELPAYHFQGQVTQDGDKATLHFILAQSGVSPGFKMSVPLYLEYVDGKVFRLGTVNVIGSNTVEKTVPLPKLPAAVKRVSINYYYDVLSIDN
ncbi:MAG: M1 family aminopeptidase [Terracidiphilus sp.]